MKKEGASESIGVFAVVLGIMSVALPLASFPFTLFFACIVGFILAVTALVFAFKSSTWRKAAFTFAIIGIILNILSFFWVVSIIAGLVDYISQLEQTGALQQLAGASG
jgi:hypothetical protein